MYPSLIMLPLPQVMFAVINRVCGPMKTLSVSRRIASGVIGAVGQRGPGADLGSLAFEQKVIERLMPRPWIACLETACAFEMWLSFHGVSCQICLGRKVCNGQICMHAWVESGSEKFFYAPGFEKVEWKMM